MISQRTTIKLANSFCLRFEKLVTQTKIVTEKDYLVPDIDKIFDFLYGNNVDLNFCNKFKSIKVSYDSGLEPLKEFILKIHSGEIFEEIENLEERKFLGQKYLKLLAELILVDFRSYFKPPVIIAYLIHIRDVFSGFFGEFYKLHYELKASLELDGYKLYSGKLLAFEEDIFDVNEITGYLYSLVDNLQLENQDIFVHHLKLSEEHYINNNWDDSISNSRKVLEYVLREAAKITSHITFKKSLSNNILSSPFKVREYLETNGLLEKKEKEAIAKIYGLLSATGGHPYMAENDQARLLRHLALTCSQFVLLRLQGAISN